MKKQKKIKFKTRKSVLKRIKITGTGKILRGRSFNRHLRAKKSKRRQRALSGTVRVNKTLTKKLKNLLGLS